jgi:hypothetical protein
MVTSSERLSSRQLLVELSQGHTISAEEGIRLLSPSYRKVIGEITQNIEVVCSKEAEGDYRTYWITGEPGNGKSQALWQVIHDLPRRGKRNKNYVYVYIDFDENPAASQPENMPVTIVRKSLSGGAIEEAEQACAEILRGSSADQAVKNFATFGISVLAKLAGYPSPSALIGGALRPALRWARLRRGYVEWSMKRRLRDKWSAYPPLVRLASDWVSYVVQPTTKRERDFSETLRDRANDGTLFDLFCFGLKQADYSAMVLLCDEVSTVAIENMKSLWDKPLENSSFYHDLNLVLVLVPKEGVWDEVKTEKVLERRFGDTTRGHRQLEGPIIGSSGKDDFDHVVDKVRLLLEGAPAHLSRSDLAPQELERELERLRGVLSQRSGVTWPNLWKSVIDLMTNL